MDDGQLLQATAGQTATAARGVAVAGAVAKTAVVLLKFF